MKVSAKRAEYLSIVALLLSLIFFVVVLLVGNWSGFSAVSELGWFLLSSALVWVVLVIQFHQRSLAEREKLDIAQSVDSDEQTIFQSSGGRGEVLAVAQNRLKLLEKWFLPVFSALIAIYHVIFGISFVNSLVSMPGIEARQPLVCAIYMTAIAFINFLVSRYAVGMSSQNEWKPLRAGGSYSLATAILAFALAIGLALYQFEFTFLISIIKWVIPVLMIVLGAEIVLNLIMDIYRPRIEGQYNRSAFDSRLLGMFSEPGHIFETAATAIDYQFGFRISQTWFYKMLEKTVIPLVIFAGVVVYLLSCFVIVEPNEKVIIEHFGNPVTSSGEVRIKGAGLHIKYPWPIDRAYKYPTEKVMELTIGYVPEKDSRTGRLFSKAKLWGKSHYAEEYKLLVASEHSSGSDQAGAAPVSFVMAAVPVQYRIKDLYSYIYGHRDTAGILEDICYRELTRFAASSGIEVDEKGDIRKNLLGAGRSKAQTTLSERVQQAADKAGLGVEIVFLGLQGIHPPPDVAGAYHKVVGSVQTKQAEMLYAHAGRNRTLSLLAGSVEQAEDLYSLARKYQQGRSEDKSKELADLLDSEFINSGGDIYKTLKEATSYSYEKAELARATGERFSSQLKAYRAAPEIYKQQQRLTMLEQSLEDIRKYVVIADSNYTQIFIVDVQEKLMPSLYDIGEVED
jgi:regulator of protease activity HflC (stomatin/prohibitin superfamily)